MARKVRFLSDPALDTAAVAMFFPPYPWFAMYSLYLRMTVLL